MKKVSFKAFVVTTLIVLSSYSAFAEFVFLKDGSILEGKIISDTA